DNFLSEDDQAVKLSVVLDSNPYEDKALSTVEKLRDNENKLIEDSGFSKDQFELHYASQTAEQLDVKQMNTRDTILLFSLVIVLLTFILVCQSHFFKLLFLIVVRILLYYFVIVGFGWWIFDHLMGYYLISYLIPVYTFIFMVALGIDYNIMLV